MKRSKSLAGYSLSEVVLAILLISLALLSAVGVFTSGFKLLTQTQSQDYAYDLARAVLERTKNLGYAAVPPDVIFLGGPPDAGGFPPSPYPSRGDFRLEVLTRTVESDLISVQVTVLREEKPVCRLETYLTP